MKNKCRHCKHYTMNKHLSFLEEVKGLARMKNTPLKNLMGNCHKKDVLFAVRASQPKCRDFAGKKIAQLGGLVHDMLLPG